MNIKHELRRIIRQAVSPIGGSGGRRQCQYCLRESYAGQPQHFRVDVEGETDHPCEADVMKAALKAIEE